MNEMFIQVPPRNIEGYRVTVAQGWQPELLEEIKKAARGKIFLLSQKGLEEYVVRELSNFLDPLRSSGQLAEEIILIEAGEENKHLSRLGPIYNRLLELGLDRSSLILAAGGGVVGDLVGYVAATIQRGVDFVQLPSTLLSAVDSSVGGKVAVNVDYGKNMVGAFHQPRLVYFNQNLLQTLPKREWLCGLTELLKHAFIQPGGELYRRLKGGAERFRDLSDNFFGEVLLDAIDVKARVVEQDEKEGGLRAILNLGHTTAHSIESVTNYTRFSHGEAVARGLVTMLILSRELCGFSTEDEAKILELMQEYNLPLDTADLDGEELYLDMKYDKKSVGGDPRFVLLTALGETRRDCRVSLEQFQAAWREQKDRFG